MREYICHKRVKAGKIVAMGRDFIRAEVAIRLENGDVVNVPTEFVQKHAPQPGGYLVQYEDGYRSYSPAATFEAGYTLAAETK